MSIQDFLTENIFPDNVEYIIERIEETDRNVLHPEEYKYCANFCKKRRLEYIVGRSCAKYLLHKLGRHNHPLLTGSHGEPLWPSGVIGSISHCGDYCVVAVTNQNCLAGLGVDVERYEPLSREIEKIICTASEREWIESKKKNDKDVPWSKIVFSAKESAYKCVFPHIKTFVDFHDAEIDFHHSDNTFKLSVNNTTKESIFRSIFPLVKGFFSIEGKYIFTISCIYF